MTKFILPLYAVVVAHFRESREESIGRSASSEISSAKDDELSLILSRDIAHEWRVSELSKPLAYTLYIKGATLLPCSVP